MAIQFCDEIEKRGRFKGWRVSVDIRGKRYRKSFSLEKLSNSIPDDVWYRYQHTKARYHEAKLLARAAATQYVDFISSEHRGTKPCRGVGFHGLTLGIGKLKRNQDYQCYFSVNVSGRPHRVPVTQSRNLTESWQKAVSIWGRLHGIRQKDIDKKMKDVPAPERFKELRQHMNANEGKSIPVDVLHHVFAEKRLELEKQKSLRKVEVQFSDQDLMEFQNSLKQEIQSYQASR